MNTDKGIAKSAETELTKAGLNNITVEVTDGTATLHGQVNGLDEMSDAERIVKKVEDIKKVINNLSIDADITTLENYTDKVRHILKAFPSISAIVSDSMIILQGKIQKSYLQPIVIELEGLSPKKIETKNLKLE